jgi:hypothetical protein
VSFFVYIFKEEKNDGTSSEVKAMKYQEYNISKKLFGEDYLIYDWNETEKENHLYVKSQSHTGRCPNCGEESGLLHATYNRTIQMYPIHGKCTYAHVKAYKFNCKNNECNRKVFAEGLPFTSPFQVRTTELTLLVLAVSIFLSNEGASKVLGLFGIKISDDGIKRIYDSIEIQDEPEIEAVGIDDVSIRKGRSYATAIYDLHDHHLVALLKGRDAGALKEWLKTHKKINLVTRDRASAYAQAIKEILPDCVQVADRFHLLQNLIERMREIFKAELPDEIFIKDGEVMDAAPGKAKKIKIAPESNLLELFEYDNDEPMDEIGCRINYDNKSRNLERKQYINHAESRKKNSN